MAQCPSSSFIISSNACLNENLPLTNTSTNYDSIYWDFCSADIASLTPIASSSTIAGLSDGWGVKLVKDGNQWFGFLVDRASNSIIRLVYGNSLVNTPAISNLGNINNQLSNPEGIDLIKENGSWYAFVPSLDPNFGIVKLAFSGSLANTPTATNIGNFGFTGRIREVKALNQNGNYILLFLQYETQKIIRINYRDSFTNNISLADIYETQSITDAVNSIGIEIINNCGNWKALETSITSNKIIQLDFGNDILSEPTVEASYSFTGVSNPRKISSISENGNRYVFVANSTGNISIIDFKDLNIANQPSELDNTNFNQLIALHSVAFEGKKILVGVNKSSNLYTYIFSADCGQSLEYSGAFEPNGLSYTSPGIYQIELTAVNTTSGFTHSSTQSITVSASPAPQISGTISGNCLSAPLSFSGQEISGTVTAWNWDFGDGMGTSALQNATYTYAAAGEYRVKLSVTDANGCNNLYIDTARVYEEPIPDFTVPAGSLCMNNPIVFTNTTTGETGPVVSWTWDFNGEGSSTAKEPTFTFSTSGSKTVTLTSSLPGCANVTQQTITIEEAPTTAFTFNNVCNGQATTFTDATTGSNLTTWSWDFGDGATSTEPSPTHTYVNPGKYPVTLTVDNSLGCSTSFTDTVYNHAIPVVGFSNDLACSSAPVQFTDQSVVQDASLVAWEWDFGDGTTASERNPQHLYGQTGDFTVQLKAYSQYGCVDSLSTTLTVIQGPEVDFSWDKACASEATSFTDQSNTFGMPVTDYTWLIDGQVYNEQNPQHTFSTAGDYQVTFSVTTDNLCAATTSRTLTVDPTPATGFGMEESCQTGNVSFYDTTQAAIASRIWRIDGSQAGGDSLLTLTLAPGNYLAALNVVTTAGCNGSALRQITVNGAPQAAFEVPSAYGAAPYIVPFANLSGSYDSLRWYFGDPANSTSTATNPTFTYTDTGSYQVALIAYGLTCSDTARLTIEVVEPQHGLTLTDIILLDAGQLVLSLDNTGSLTYNSTNTEVLFSFDNGGSLTEALKTELYALQVVNYVPEVRLQDFGNANSLCISLYYKDSSGKLLLDKNCLTLTDTYVSAPYPNPATGTTSFDVVASEAGTATMRLLSRSGQIVWQETEQPLARGLNTFTIDTTPYRAGLYILEVSQGGSTSKHKLVIRK